MSFEVTADAYARFMGRYSEPLSHQFAQAAQARRGQDALDVGCGPGALTAVLVARLGADAVTAIDPSDSFVDATRARLPGVDVRSSRAEDLPFDDAAFDLTLAQLVVHFMSEPVTGLAEMARVTRPGGTVAACVWDHAGGSGPLSAFWRAARDVDPGAVDESGLHGAREGHLLELFEAAGVAGAVQTTLEVTVAFASFADWWEPFTFGVGPAGAHVAALDAATRERLRRRCAERLSPEPFRIVATAWCVCARV